MKEDDNEKFANVTHYTKVDVQPGGINIQHVEHLHQADVLKALGIELEIKKDGQPLKTECLDDVANRDAIVPADCTAAIGKVIVPTFTINDVVLNSQRQLTKASEQINLTSNSEVAMLMAIGQEVNAVRPGCKCPDFVRALIGMGVITYTDNTAIDKMAGGMTKKLNGYNKGETKYPPLPANHLRWNSNDLPIGKRIYEAMISQE